MLKDSANIAKKNNFNAIHPVHLFLGLLKIDSEVNLELKSLISIDTKVIEDRLNSCIPEKIISEYGQIKYGCLEGLTISKATKNVIFEAKSISELYEEHGQIFVSQEHILRAVLNCDDEVTKKCLGDLDKNLIISIMASPRDMLVNLDFNFNIQSIKDVSIRKVTNNDVSMLREFVMKNFYERWANTIEYGLSLKDIPIYVAILNGEIIGFSGYNISKRREGYFGPLGVLRLYRDKKIGCNLLNACLMDMRKLGYKTCTIGNAISIEFYKKSCGAKIITER